MCATHVVGIHDCISVSMHCLAHFALDVFNSSVPFDLNFLIARLHIASNLLQIPVCLIYFKEMFLKCSKLELQKGHTVMFVTNLLISFVVYKKDYVTNNTQEAITTQCHAHIFRKGFKQNTRNPPKTIFLLTKFHTIHLQACPTAGGTLGRSFIRSVSMGFFYNSVSLLPPPIAVMHQLCINYTRSREQFSAFSVCVYHAQAAPVAFDSTRAACLPIIHHSGHRSCSHI